MATVEVRGAHSSGQFSDTPDQQKSDAARLVKRMVERKWRYLTGTEAGTRSVLDVAFENIDDPAGLRFRKGVGGDVWIMHRKDLFDHGSVEQEFHKVVDGHSGPGGFADRGVFRVTGHSPLVKADLTILVCHYLTKGHPNEKGFRSDANRRIAAKIGALGTEYGRGRNLVFYGGDQNISDRTFDTFLGAPFTSLADELDKVQNTGHGPIDVMANYDKDVRAKGKSFRVFDDSEFPLATDHWLCEGSWTVKV